MQEIVPCNLGRDSEKVWSRVPFFVSSEKFATAGWRDAMWALIRGEPDVVIRWAGQLILFGMLLAFLSVQLDWPGVITAVFAIGLGAAGGSLVHWRDERGLWMLAGVFLLIYTAIYALSAFGQVGDIIRGARQPEISLVIDFSVGTMLLSATLRFLWRVARENWTFSHT